MTDKKISELDAASEPLAGTEIVPVVQTGATVRTSTQAVANLAPIATLSPASTPLAGTELVAISQGGTKVRATVQDVADLFPIATLSPASTPLVGTELVPISQSGSKVRATVQDIADLSAGAYFTLIATDRIVGSNAGANQSGNRVFLGGLNAGANSTISDFIVIGSSAADAGITVSDLDGSVVLGASAATALTGSNQLGLSACVIIGRNALAASARASRLVLIGDNAFAAMLGQPFINEPSNSVVIGNSIARRITAGGPSNNVLIGNSIGDNGVSNTSISANVVIGHRAVFELHSAGSFANSVVIGSNALGGTFANNTIVGDVYVGALAGQGHSGNASSNVIIGSSAGGTQTSPQRNVCIGQLSVSGSQRNVILGDEITRYTGAAQRNIIIGAGAGANESTAAVNTFLIETNDGTQRALLYGVLGNGNLCVGDSRQGTNRDFQGTNSLKIINGTRGAGNPSGGGFFYVSAGALHWVGSGGTDTTIAPA